MNTKSTYKTKQKDILIEYFKSVEGKHIAASDVCEYVKKQGASIGQSTIYRQLERMVDDGVLNKYIIDGNSPACFEYIGEDTFPHSTPCFHCKCEKCGKLIHLHCDEVEEMQAHLYKEHRFQMNPRRTVFYGLCEECAELD